MDCLINYIGVKDCTVEPESGILINTLPGIKTDIIEAIASCEETTYIGVWNNVNRVAARRFHADVIGALRERYILKTLRQQFEFIPEAGDNEAAAAEYRGIQLDFAYHYYSFQSFIISGVYLIARNSGNTTLKIFNRAGVELYSKAVSFVAGVNLYPIDRAFSADRLFVGLDFTTIDGSASDISDGTESCFCQVVYAMCHDDCSPSFSGAIKSGGLVTTTEKNSHGVGLFGAAACDYSSIICNNKSLFGSAWLYLLGNQLIIQLLAADRLNKYTTTDREKYEELRDHYQVQYEMQLAQAVKGINLNTAEDCCIECNTNPKSVEWLP